MQINGNEGGDVDGLTGKRGQTGFYAGPAGPARMSSE